MSCSVEESALLNHPPLARNLYYFSASLQCCSTTQWVMRQGTFGQMSLFQLVCACCHAGYACCIAIRVFVKKDFLK